MSRKKPSSGAKSLQTKQVARKPAEAQAPASVTGDQVSTDPVTTGKLQDSPVTESGPKPAEPPEEQEVLNHPAAPPEEQEALDREQQRRLEEREALGKKQQQEREDRLRRLEEASDAIDIPEEPAMAALSEEVQDRVHREHLWGPNRENVSHESLWFREDAPLTKHRKKLLFDEKSMKDRHEISEKYIAELQEYEAAKKKGTLPKGAPKPRDLRTRFDECGLSLQRISSASESEAPVFPAGWPPLHWESSPIPIGPDTRYLIAWCEFWIAVMETQEGLPDRFEPEWLEEHKGALASVKRARKKVIRDLFRLVRYLDRRGYEKAPNEPGRTPSVHGTLRVFERVRGWILRNVEQGGGRPESPDPAAKSGREANDNAVPAQKDGYILRSQLWLSWYESKGDETFHSPAKIRDKWNSMTSDERASLVAGHRRAQGEIAQKTKGAEVVEKAIKKAKEVRDNLKKS